MAIGTFVGLLVYNIVGWLRSESYFVRISTTIFWLMIVLAFVLLIIVLIGAFFYAGYKEWKEHKER